MSSSKKMKVDDSPSKLQQRLLELNEGEQSGDDDLHRLILSELRADPALATHMFQVQGTRMLLTHMAVRNLLPTRVIRPLLEANSDAALQIMVVENMKMYPLHYLVGKTMRAENPSQEDVERVRLFLEATSTSEEILLHDCNDEGGIIEYEFIRHALVVLFNHPREDIRRIAHPYIVKIQNNKEDLQDILNGGRIISIQTTTDNGTGEIVSFPYEFIGSLVDVFQPRACCIHLRMPLRQSDSSSFDLPFVFEWYSRETQTLALCFSTRANLVSLLKCVRSSRLHGISIQKVVSSIPGRIKSSLDAPFLDAFSIPVQPEDGSLPDLTSVEKLDLICQVRTLEELVRFLDGIYAHTPRIVDVRLKLRLFVDPDDATPDKDIKAIFLRLARVPLTSLYIEPHNTHRSNRNLYYGLAYLLALSFKPLRTFALKNNATRFGYWRNVLKINTSLKHLIVPYLDKSDSRDLVQAMETENVTLTKFDSESGFLGPTISFYCKLNLLGRGRLPPKNASAKDLYEILQSSGCDSVPVIYGMLRFRPDIWASHTT